MDQNRVEQLLREYARLIPPERLFSDEARRKLRDRLQRDAEKTGPQDDPRDLRCTDPPAARAR